MSESGLGTPPSGLHPTDDETTTTRTDGPGPRWFAVKLTLADVSEPQQVNYAVLGLDPLQVFREVDYNRACGME